MASRLRRRIPAIFAGAGSVSAAAGVTGSGSAADSNSPVAWTDGLGDVFSLTPGQAFSYTLTATDVDGDSIGFDYDAAALPAWITVTVESQSGNSRSLVLSGTAPLTETSASVALTATESSTNFAFADIPEIVFVEGYAEDFHMGVFHLDTTNRTKPGDLHWLNGTALQTHPTDVSTYGRSTAWVPVRSTSVSGSLPTGVTYNSATGKLSYNGGATTGSATVRLVDAASGVSSNQFRVRVLRPKIVWGYGAQAVAANYGAQWGDPSVSGHTWATRVKPHLITTDDGTQTTNVVLWLGGTYSPVANGVGGYTHASTLSFDGSQAMYHCYILGQPGNIPLVNSGSAESNGGSGIWCDLFYLKNLRNIGPSPYRLGFLPRSSTFNTPTGASRQTGTYIVNYQMEMFQSITTGSNLSDDGIAGSAFESEAQSPTTVTAAPDGTGTNIIFTVTSGATVSSADYFVTLSGFTGNYSVLNGEQWTLTRISSTQFSIPYACSGWPSHGSARAYFVNSCSYPIGGFMHSVNVKGRRVGSSLKHGFYVHGRPNFQFINNNGHWTEGNAGGICYKTTSRYVRHFNHYFSVFEDNDNPDWATLAAGRAPQKFIDAASSSVSVIYNCEFHGARWQTTQGGPTMAIYYTPRNSIFKSDEPPPPNVEFQFGPTPTTDPTTWLTSHNAFHLGYQPSELNGWPNTPATWWDNSFWAAVKATDRTDGQNPYTFKHFISHCEFTWYLDGSLNTVIRQAVRIDTTPAAGNNGTGGSVQLLPHPQNWVERSAVFMANNRFNGWDFADYSEADYWYRSGLTDENDMLFSFAGPVVYDVTIGSADATHDYPYNYPAVHPVTGAALGGGLTMDMGPCPHRMVGDLTEVSPRVLQQTSTVLPSWFKFGGEA